MYSDGGILIIGGGGLIMGDGGGLTVGEGGGLVIGDGGGLIMGDGGGLPIGGDGGEMIGGGLLIGDGGGGTIGDGGGLITGDGGGDTTGDGGGEMMGDGGGDVTRDGGGDEVDDIDDAALLPAPRDIIGTGKNIIDPTLPADEILFISFCAFCITFQSSSFGCQSLGMIPLSSNSSLSCSYNALKLSSSVKSAANLSKVRKSCASLNL